MAGIRPSGSIGGVSGGGVLASPIDDLPPAVVRRHWRALGAGGVEWGEPPH
jgi:hypothetical protein